MADPFSDLWSAAAVTTKKKSAPHGSNTSNKLGDLLLPTPTRSSGTNVKSSNLTIAQRLAMEAQKKSVIEEPPPLSFPDTTWVGLDSLLNPTSTNESGTYRDLIDHDSDDDFGVLTNLKDTKTTNTNTNDEVDVHAELEALADSEETKPERGAPSIEWETQEPSLIPKKISPKGSRERYLEKSRREQTPNSSGGSDIVSDMQEHADRLITQASEIGLNVLTKATVFWKEGKGRVTKAYEERTATSTFKQKERMEGRPKWMTDTNEEDDYAKTKRRPVVRGQRVRQQGDLLATPDLDLFSAGPSESAPPPQVDVADAPLPTRERHLPTASPATLSTVDKHRNAGGSQFKLGQYSTAIDSYNVAISSLPPGHLLLLPLFNNRALARIRTGEYKSAADDAAQALKIILIDSTSAGLSDEFDPNAIETTPRPSISSWHPSMEPSFLIKAAQQKGNNGGWAHPQGIGVDITDGYVKALRRGAEAMEGRERWSEALNSWELLSSGDCSWIKDTLRKESQKNAARCRKAIADEKMGAELPKPKPKSHIPKPTRPITISATTPPPSTALRALQATNAEAEAENNLKYQLKDSVDSMLAAWRTGKENNIRALLASLDMVLWEDLLRGFKVGGLHELVTPAQVKKGYMKAIARVHPDKLSAQNSTVEQRMLANGVFGTLSDAWVSFQNSNGI